MGAPKCPTCGSRTWLKSGVSVDTNPPFLRGTLECVEGHQFEGSYCDDDEEDPMYQTEPMLQFFQYEHLPEKLQAFSKPWFDLATHVVATLPRNPERTVALRKLLEGKDCAVRASLWKD